MQQVTFELALSAMIAFAVGYTAVSLVWAKTGRPSSALLVFRAFLALGVGQGITACLAFVFLVVRGRLDRSYVFAEVLVLLTLIGLHVLARRRRDPETFRVPGARDVPRPGYEWLLAALFGVATMIAFAAIGAAMDRVPHGDWDAWAIYNLRARSIYRSGYDWRDGFSPLLSLSHPDYPPLLSLDVVRAWIYAGSETMAAPQLIGGIFMVATIGLVPSAIAALRGPSQAYIAGIVLVGNAFLLRHSVSQYADVPLMFFFAAAAALLVVHDELGSEGNMGALTLAGVAAGLATWTKNEGVLFAAALAVSHFAVVARTRGWRLYARQLRPLAAGLLPALAILVYFKLTLAPPGDLVSLITKEAVWAKVTDPGRYFTIAGELIQRAPPRVYLLAICGICIGLGARRIAGVAQAALTLLLLSAGYLAVFLTTPYELSWHISTSLDRLLMQIWPSFVLVYFLALRTPEEVFQIGTNPA